MAFSGLVGFGRWSRSLAAGAGLATARFPLAVALIVAIAAIANLEVADVHLMADEDLVWLLAALSAALSTSVGLRLLAESHAWKSGATLAVPPLGAAAAGLLIWNAQGIGVLAPPLLAALCLSIPLVPYLARRDDRKFWTFTLWTAVGITLAFISVLIFVLGVSAILEMIRYLFGIGLSSGAYEHIYTTALTLVGPLFALGRIPADFDEAVSAGPGDRVTAGVRPLLGWVAAPLTLATAVVIHLYAAKILVTQEVPKGEIGWIVSFYALLVLSLRLAAEPFLVDGAASTRLFGRLWAPLLVVPIGLLVYALGIRIAAEGVTLERYYLGLAALASVLVLVAQLTRWRGDIRLMAAVPLVLLALSSFGPWGVASAVGRSQAALLAESLPVGADADAAGPSEALRSSLRSRLTALQAVDELDRVLPLLSESQRAEVETRIGGQPDLLSATLMSVLGLDYGRNEAPAEALTTFSTGQPAALDLAGFDRALIDRNIQRGDAGRGERPGLALDADNLVIAVEGATDSFPLTDALSAMAGLAEGTTGANPDPGGVAPFVVDLASAGGRSVRLQITVAVWNSASREPVSLNATVLLRSADWPASLGGGGNPG
ncbi:DUF4153 domain-containing protein [Aureimonas glaciei]|uniref:DUF4153 domain-containing protein n=1 Tax=Aureimonas glaciei TaxID=1776957 RepID=A0A916XZV8_9HYPH|nr:DUF4153 domain-containing protein [Aureimonas glaciei]GGD22605.1 hypothetical protein GCM10011335_26890 [Aureimonas glaciei]